MRFRILLQSCIAGALAVWAGTVAAAPLNLENGTWTVSPAVTSKYLFRGVEIGGASFQPWVDYTAGPLSLGIWSSVGLSDRIEGQSDPELDLYGAYSFQSESGGFSLIPGFFLYTYPEAERSNGAYSATFEPSLAANFIVKGIQFTPKIYYDVMLEGATYELSAALALPLKTLGTELDFSASVGTFKWNAATADAVPAVKNWGDYWTIGVAVPVQVTMRSKLTLGVVYAEGRNNFYKQGTLARQINEAARGRCAVTLSYAITL